jgi:hypothetical protein
MSNVKAQKANSSAARQLGGLAAKLLKPMTNTKKTSLKRSSPQGPSPLLMPNAVEGKGFQLPSLLAAQLPSVYGGSEYQGSSIVPLDKQHPQVSLRYWG